MKKLMFFAAMILTMGLVSCSSDDEIMQGPIKVKLAPSKASKVTFYSNGNELDANGNVVGTNTSQRQPLSMLHVLKKMEILML